LAAAEDDDDDDDDDEKKSKSKSHHHHSSTEMTSSSANTMMQQKAAYNYYLELSFVNRHLLDFDFEKRCSVSLAKDNCYCCLTCGQFFAGRGSKTPAYTHALERENHRVFMHLENGRAYSLPENVEILDKSLDDIRKVLFPKFTSEEIARLEKEATWSKALDGTEYLVGVVGLNRVENARGVNCVIQSLARVDKLRKYFLTTTTTTTTNDTLQSLCQRIWNKHNFRGHTSPDSFVRKLKKQIKLANPDKLETDVDALFNDPFATLRHFLTFVVPKKHVDELFRGELLMLNQKNKKTQPFVFVPLKLPDAPLFRDVMEKNAIPQVSLAELLKPFALKTAPEYLILAFVNRFSKNQFTKEVSKNPTIVTFPVKNLKIASSSPSSSSEKTTTTTTTTVSYDLLANVDAAGKATVKHVDGTWYETNDLFVGEVLAQQVTLGEAYVQIYERQQRTQK
jgi:U4/U6.U5 tri-snRNP-associated protein 2